MRISVVYESMFGNTRQVAEAVAAELRPDHDVSVVTAGEAAGGSLDPFDLVIVGTPTHAHGLPRPPTRRSVPSYVARSEGSLRAEPTAQDPGVREWLRKVGDGRVPVAAFDTRLKLPALLVGRPSRAVARSLRSHGYAVAATASFFVDKQNHLLAGELDRAGQWANQVVAAAAGHGRQPATR